MTTTTMSDIVATAMDLYADMPLRAELIHDPIATVKPTRQAHPGATVTFNRWNDLAAATSTLDEVTDVEVVAPTITKPTVTIAEYGNAARTTRKLRGVNYLPSLEPDLANLIGYNGGISIDTVVRTVLNAGTNVIYGGAATSRVTVAAGHTLTAAKVRYAIAKLRGGFAPTWGMEGYLAFIHPDVSVDLRAETGADAWVQPANYSAVTQRWAGAIQRFEGAMFVEAPRAAMFANAGAGSTVDVYSTLFIGQRALAKSYAERVTGPTPGFEIGPVVDRLNRHRTYGWYWLGGYAVYQQECLYRIESSSSIGAN